jgi:hypothetical protein
MGVHGRFLFGEVICLLNCVNERDLDLLANLLPRIAGRKISLLLLVAIVTAIAGYEASRILSIFMEGGGAAIERGRCRGRSCFDPVPVFFPFSSFVLQLVLEQLKIELGWISVALPVNRPRADVSGGLHYPGTCVGICQTESFETCIPKLIQIAMAF